MPEKATDPLSHSGSNPNQIYPLDSSHRVEKSPAPAGDVEDHVTGCILVWTRHGEQI